MRELSFIVWGNAIPKQSTKAYINKGGYGPKIFCYTPKKITNWHDDVRKSVLPVKPKQLFEGAIAGIIIFYINKPKSKPKWKIYHDTKPDIDNLTKNILDPLHGVVLNNDSQLVFLIAVKIYDPENTPHVDVTLFELEENKEKITTLVEVLDRATTKIKILRGNK